MGNAVYAMSGSYDVPSPPTGLTIREQYSIAETWSAFRRDLPTGSMSAFIVLFSRYPEYKMLFPALRHVPFGELSQDPRLMAHGMAVFYFLSAMVDSLENPDTLVELIRKNSLNHVRRAVTPHHFDQMAVVIVQVLQDKLRARMTATATTAWQKLFKFHNDTLRAVYARAQVMQMSDGTPIHPSKSEDFMKSKLYEMRALPMPNMSPRTPPNSPRRSPVISPMISPMRTQSGSKSPRKWLRIAKSKSSEVAVRNAAPLVETLEEEQSKATSPSGSQGPPREGEVLKVIERSSRELVAGAIPTVSKDITESTLYATESKRDASDIMQKGTEIQVEANLSKQKESTDYLLKSEGATSALEQQKTELSSEKETQQRTSGESSDQMQLQADVQPETRDKQHVEIQPRTSESAGEQLSKTDVRPDAPRKVQEEERRKSPESTDGLQSKTDVQLETRDSTQEEKELKASEHIEQPNVDVNAAPDRGQEKTQPKASQSLELQTKAGAQQERQLEEPKGSEPVDKLKSREDVQVEAQDKIQQSAEQQVEQQPGKPVLVNELQPSSDAQPEARDAGQEQDRLKTSASNLEARTYVSPATQDIKLKDKRASEAAEKLEPKADIKPGARDIGQEEEKPKTSASTGKLPVKNLPPEAEDKFHEKQSTPEQLEVMQAEASMIQEAGEKGQEERLSQGTDRVLPNVDVKPDGGKQEEQQPKPSETSEKLLPNADVKPDGGKQEQQQPKPLQSSEKLLPNADVKADARQEVQEGQQPNASQSTDKLQPKDVQITAQEPKKSSGEKLQGQSDTQQKAEDNLELESLHQARKSESAIKPLEDVGKALEIVEELTTSLADLPPAAKSDLRTNYSEEPHVSEPPKTDNA
ncbi:uncharacterized protein LOC135400146 [Ornithodoros turicata]|uniref:uncharacterized protein LOC135400146 n=1 Tax=Ornithodoros turicata TaxID=34597 RepID=UPI003138DE3E